VQAERVMLGVVWFLACFSVIREGNQDSWCPRELILTSEYAASLSA